MDVPSLATSERESEPSDRAKNPSALGLSAIDPARRPAVGKRVAETPPSARRGYLRAAAGTASPRQAIKALCMECGGWQRDVVRFCTAVACPLYAYRPFQGEGTAGSEV